MSSNRDETNEVTAGPQFGSIEQAVREYTRRGWPVIPLYGINVPGRLTCTCMRGHQCGTPGKHPTMQHGVDDATSDADEAIGELRRHRQPNIGILTGATSGVIVLDVDTQEGQQSVMRLGVPSGTPRVKSGRASGGWHYYFRAPEEPIGCITGIMPGIDVKGERGYVVAPPSRHISGACYTWEAPPGPEDLPESPSWLKLMFERTRASRKAAEAIANTSQHHLGGGFSRTPMSPVLLESRDILGQKLLDQALKKAMRGTRHTVGTSLAGRLRDHAFPREEAREIMRQYAQGVPQYEGCTTYSEQEALDGLDWALTKANWVPRPPTVQVTDQEEETLNYMPMTDSGNAESLALLYGNSLRCDHTRGGKTLDHWYVWGLHRWMYDETGHRLNIAKNVARLRRVAARGIEDEKISEKMVKWAKNSENLSKMNSALRLAASLSPIASRFRDFDPDDTLFGVANGVVDLTTGALIPGRQDHMISMGSEVDYDVDAECPRWDRFLEEVFETDSRPVDTSNDKAVKAELNRQDQRRELLTWFNRAVGYTLTGYSSEQCFFLVYGLGGNGKSVIRIIMQKLLGEYSVSLPFDTFSVSYRSAGGPSPELARLRGKRMACFSEVPGGAHTQTATLKDCSGGENIWARGMYEKGQEFAVKAKLWFFGNRKPLITDIDEGFWRRIRLIELTGQFTPHDEPDLMDKLHAELPGILAKYVREALAWMRDRLPNVSVVMSAVQKYREGQDFVSAFVEECCRLDPAFEAQLSPEATQEHQEPFDKTTTTYRTRPNMIQSRYKEWCKANSLPKAASRLLNDGLQRMGLEKIKAGTYTWRGIQLINDVELSE